MTPTFDFDISTVDLSTAPGLEPGATLGSIGAASEPAPAGIVDIFSRATAYTLELRRFGVRRKVASGAVDVDSDKDLIHVSKEILVSPALKAIEQFDGETRRILNGRALPLMQLKGGVLLPNASVAEIDAMMEGRAAARLDLVERFMGEYVRCCAEAPGRLRALYRPEEYPAADAVRESFSMRTAYLQVEVPTNLPAAIYQREREKAAAQWTEAIEECRQVLRAELLTLVEHATERLAPGNDGKPKIFRDSMLKNLDEFFSTFNDRNSIGEDRELAAIVDQARQVLAGVDAGDLRRRDNFRADVAARLGDVRTKLDAMIRPVARGFSAEREE